MSTHEIRVIGCPVCGIRTWYCAELEEPPGHYCGYLPGHYCGYLPGHYCSYLLIGLLDVPSEDAERLISLTNYLERQHANLEQTSKSTRQR